MVTGMEELENHQINRDMVSVLDFSITEVEEYFLFRLFSTAFISNLFFLLFSIHWLKSAVWI